MKIVKPKSKLERYLENKECKPLTEEQEVTEDPEDDHDHE